MTELGRYLDIEGRPAVRFERTYQHPIDRVWSAVTAPEELAQWFPSNVDLEPRVGGIVKFSGDPHTDGLQGCVLVYDPPRRLSFSWGPDELWFELEPLDGERCRLTLTNLLSERNTAARNASGWTVCLDELDKHISGEASDGPHSEANEGRFKPLYDGYIAAGMPAGADIPDLS